MTEKELISLGFKKISVSAEESGDVPFYYYTLDLTKYFSFITNDSTSISNNTDWNIQIFNHPQFRWYDKDGARLFINLMKDNCYHDED